MRRGLGWVVGAYALLMVGGAQAATTWTVVDNADCTAAGAPAPCCTASKKGYCLERMSVGNRRLVFVEFSADGSATYTNPGGDSPAVSQLAKIGLGMLVNLNCYRQSNGRVIVPVRSVTPLNISGSDSTVTLKFKFFDAGGTEKTGAQSVANEVVSCEAWGY